MGPNLKLVLESSKRIRAGSIRNEPEIGTYGGAGYEENGTVRLENMNWKSLKVIELRNECRNRGLPSQGLKAELVAILEDSSLHKINTPNFNSMTVSELRIECLKRDLESKGRKADLIARLCNVSVSTKESVTTGSEVISETIQAINRVHSSQSCSPLSNSKIISPAEQAEESASSSGPKRLDFNLMKVVELRKECKTRGIPSKGKKAEIIARLEEDIS